MRFPYLPPEHISLVAKFIIRKCNNLQLFIIYYTTNLVKKQSVSAKFYNIKMDSTDLFSTTKLPPESKLAVSQISDLFSLLFSILYRFIRSTALMLNTANDQVRTVNHTPVTNLYRRLIVYFGRVGAYLNFIIVIQIALLVVTVLGFHIWQHKDQRRVAVAGLLA